MSFWWYDVWVFVYSDSLSCSSDVLNSQNSVFLHAYTCISPMYSLFSYHQMFWIRKFRLSADTQSTLTRCASTLFLCLVLLRSSGFSSYEHKQIMSINQHWCQAAGQYMGYILYYPNICGIYYPIYIVSLCVFRLPSPHTSTTIPTRKQIEHLLRMVAHTHTCHTLQHTATRCNTLQHTTTHLTPTLHGRRWSTH